jgi:hypothetical protein
LLSLPLNCWHSPHLRKLKPVLPVRALVLAESLLVLVLLLPELAQPRLARALLLLPVQPLAV